VAVRASDGKEHTATPNSDGVWFVEGLPAGETAVRIAARAEAFAESERKITIEEADVPDVDFAAKPAAK
jgi:hypothetical protein